MFLLVVIQLVRNRRSKQALSSSKIVGSILATDSWNLCEKSQSTLWRKSWVFSGYSLRFPPTGNVDRVGWD